MTSSLSKYKKILPVAFILVLVFYHIYPQALDIRGSSFISLSGVVGLALYAYYKFPFREALLAIGGLLGFLFIAYMSGWINNTDDPYVIGYIKSEIAWFFSAFLIIFLIFKVHKKPSFNILLLYIAGAIGLQSLIAFGMNTNEAIEHFFFSLQMKAQLTEAIMDEGGSQRLMGYGIAFFGAGAVSGVGLIAISYLLMRMKMNNFVFLGLTLLYVFTFYIGLFMARTTIVGAAVGLVLIAVLYLWDNKSTKKQARAFLIAAIFLMAAGYTFAMFYFPDFSDWAFELFTNFIRTGKLTTKSSNGLQEMFLFPEELEVRFFGTGDMTFSKTDVGYSRMLYWVGVPGTIYFYLYQAYLAKLSATKDWAVNIVSIALVVYSFALNFKGWIDLNLILFLIFFYFMFYKYYVYLPKNSVNKREIGDVRMQSRLRKR